MLRTLLVLAIWIAASGVNAMTFAERQEVRAFVEEVCNEFELDQQQILGLFAEIEPSAEVITRITTPYESLPWHKYQKIFLNEKKISGGVEFWKKHAIHLDKAHEIYGVHPELIVAIIGVESSYGEHSGKFPVLQALATLAFDYKARANFFREELKEYLLMTSEHGLDPLALKGSYAGAMGFPQFIASSYRKYAVDFDNSDSVDIINNMAHAISSVANYFKEHGWQPGMHVAHKLERRPQEFESVNDSMLLEFDLEDRKEYWVGSQNFYVITRYNRSHNYALAVYLLSQEIAKQYKKL